MVSRSGNLSHRSAPRFNYQRRGNSTLLRSAQRPTFVTTNVDDFWQRVPAHTRYGIVCLVLPDERLQETSSLLRQLFSLPDFKTKARRMGKVVRVSRGQLEYYDIRAHSIIRVPSWPG